MIEPVKDEFQQSGICRTFRYSGLASKRPCVGNRTYPQVSATFQSKLAAANSSGVAHECEADDWYGGYFIPKGTRILPLDYAFLRNPVKYPDPETFRPERWLEAGWPTFQAPLNKFPTIKGMTSFGWGQRQCLGMSLTQDEMVVATGALMWAFNLKRKVDPATGLDIEVPLDKSNSLLIVKPDPFQMVFEPRSTARRAETIEQWKQAEARDAEERAAFLRAAEKGEVVA